MKCEIVIITPRLAREIIKEEKYYVHRNSEVVIDVLAKDMRASNWLLNGETIKFTSKGFLVDGYKRIQACIKSENEFPTLVSYGVDDLAFSTPNSGKARSLFDALYIEGVKDAHIYAPLIKQLYKYKFQSLVSQNRIKNEIYYAYYQKIPKRKLNKAVKFAELLRKHSKAIGFTQLAFMFYILGQKHEEQATLFFRGILLGEETKCLNTLKAVKKKLTYTSHNQVYKLEYYPLIKLVFHAWNLYYSDTDLRAVDIPNQLEHPYGV